MLQVTVKTFAIFSYSFFFKMG